MLYCLSFRSYLSYYWIIKRDIKGRGGVQFCLLLFYPASLLRLTHTEKSLIPGSRTKFWFHRDLIPYQTRHHFERQARDKMVKKYSGIPQNNIINKRSVQILAQLNKLQSKPVLTKVRRNNWFCIDLKIAQHVKYHVFCLMLLSVVKMTFLVSVRSH